MNADSGFRLGDLGPHIGFVEGSVAEPMRLATGAGRPLDPLSYGVVGQAFALAVGVAAGIGAHAVRGLADESDGFVVGLRATRAAYEHAERVTAELFRPPR